MVDEAEADAAIAIVFVCKVHKLNSFDELNILPNATEKPPKRECKLHYAQPQPKKNCKQIT